MDLVRPACVAAAIALLLPGTARAADSAATEYEVKAAYLYNFGKFIAWPEASGNARPPFVICIIGEDPFGEVIDDLGRNKSIQDRRIQVRRIEHAREGGRCQILYIGRSESDRLGEILRALNRASTLTVGDFEHFGERGGMIEFVMQDRRVRFEINLRAVEEAKLVMSSQLLKLARAVIGAPRGTSP